MIDAIKSYFTDRMNPNAHKGEDAVNHQLQLATAALLIEMAQEDNTRHSMEFQAIHEGIQEVFRLSVEETTEIIDLADREAHEATDHFEFTALINEHFDYAHKCKVVELLWRVSLSDADMDKYEEHLVRKIAGLLHVEHRDYIAAKLKVQREYSTSYLSEYGEFE